MPEFVSTVLQQASGRGGQPWSFFSGFTQAGTGAVSGFWGLKISSPVVEGREAKSL